MEVRPTQGLSAADGLRMPSNQICLEFTGEDHFRRPVRATQPLANHVIEAAAQYVLTLQPARQDVGASQPFAQREEPVG